jgi:23S rRNA (uracil1939-C5)-methyltransferase
VTTREAPDAREARVEKLIEGGIGLAHDEGRTVLLPLAAPGERVLYATKRESRGRIDGQILRVLEPSPQRTLAPCPVYGVCGGCQIQHLSYAAQLDAKVSVARETLARLGGIALEDPLVITPAPAPFGYRHRATFHIRWEGGRAIIGFYQRRSHKVVDLVRCPLLNDDANAALAMLREAVLPACARHRPESAEIVAGEDGRAEIAISAKAPLARHDAAALARALESAPRLRAVYWSDASSVAVTILSRGEPLSYAIPSAAGVTIDASFDARVFTQANFAMNRRLVAAVIDATADLDRARLLDLHAGCGNLSLPLWPRAAYAHLADVSVEALAHAERSARKVTRAAEQEGGPGRPASGAISRPESRSAPALDLSATPAAAALDRLISARAPRPDLVILDPPRQGAAELVSRLVALAPPRILYVSCNVPTLARDLANLRRGGYDLASLQLFDMYPQTAHVEALAALTRP